MQDQIIAPNWMVFSKAEGQCSRLALRTMGHGGRKIVYSHVPHSVLVVTEVQIFLGCVSRLYSRKVARQVGRVYQRRICASHRWCSVVSAVLGTLIHKLVESNPFSFAHITKRFNALRVYHLMHEEGGHNKEVLFICCVWLIANF